MIHPLWACIGALAGLIAGSFLATLALRWGRGERVGTGRSRCDHCGTPVGTVALVPVASFVALGGRCGACGGAIDRRHVAMELGCAMVGALALGLRPGLDGAAGALFGWLIAALALLDLDHHWLPDKLTAPLAVVGIGAGLAGLDPPITDRLIGLAAGFAALTLIAWAYRHGRGREGLGGGDAKLLGAIGAWLGWRALPFVVLGAALLGLAWCLVLLTRGRAVTMTDRLPLGALLALAAWPLWLTCFDARP